MSLPRITAVFPFGIVGGAERWALTVLDERPGLDLDAVLLGRGPLEAELADRGIPVTVLDTSSSPVDMARRTGAVLRHLRRRRPDVIWSNGVKATAVVVAAAKLRRVPVVWVKHDRSFDARLARPFGRAVARVAAVSEAVAAPVGRADTVVIPPPLPDRPAEPRTEARRVWEERWPDHPPHLAATVGRLVPYKGVDTAIEAVARPEAASWGLLVVGGDDPAEPGERQRLEQLARDLDVADRVRFTGPVHEAGRWFAGLDACLVLTGRDAQGFGGEGWSTVALEALWAGAPLIGTPEGAPVAAASGGVVPPGDAAGVAVALGQLVSEDAIEAAREGGREVLDGHPDRAAVADALLALLTEVADR